MLIIFTGITLLFIGGLFYKSLTKRAFCSICVSIPLTWLVLFALYKNGQFKDEILLALLMGQSIAGLYYFVLKRLPSSLRIFTLPYFLSFTAFFYFLITSELVIGAFGLLTGLWLLAWIIFSWRNDPSKKRFADTAMNCCEED